MEELEWKIKEGERERERNSVMITGWKECRSNNSTVEGWLKRNLGLCDVVVGRMRGKVRRLGVECKG